MIFQIDRISDLTLMCISVGTLFGSKNKASIVIFMSNLTVKDDGYYSTKLFIKLCVRVLQPTTLLLASGSALCG